MHRRAGGRGSLEASDPPGAGVVGGCSHLTGAVGTELESPAEQFVF